MKQINVLLADDHRLVLDGISAVLHDQKEITVVGKVQNGEEVLAFVEENPPDVVVLDINMPIMDGITCARKLKANYPAVKIIILTMYAQKSFIEEVVRIGVDGCLLKSNTGPELASAIIRVQSGSSYYDRIQSFNEQNNEERQPKLSEREIEIIKLLGQGLTSLQIAEKLFIADHTVKTHRKNIFRKVNAHSTSELIQYAVNNKLV